MSCYFTIGNVTEKGFRKKKANIELKMLEIELNEGKETYFHIFFSAVQCSYLMF